MGLISVFCYFIYDASVFHKLCLDSVDQEVFCWKNSEEMETEVTLLCPE